MFKCIDSQAHEEVIILDSGWEGERLATLRSKGLSGCLLCPQCKQPVHVKAGEVKTWHFAHKDLGECPLHAESPAILKARERLYRWLVQKFVERQGIDPTERASVTVEKELSDNLPRLIDCYVEFPNRPNRTSGVKLAYWVFERGVRDRYLLTQGFQDTALHTVFLSTMLKPAEGEDKRFDLTPTERDFMVRSEYDAGYSCMGKSLHYLDVDTGVLTTLRGLALSHAPQRHSAEDVLVHPLKQVLATKRGEFVHPGDHEKLLEHRKQENEREERMERHRLEREQERERQRQRLRSSINLGNNGTLPIATNPVITSTSKDVQVEQRGDREAALRPATSQGWVDVSGPPTCEGCGKKTTDWVACKPSDGTCLCRDCCYRKHMEGTQSNSGGTPEKPRIGE